MNYCDKIKYYIFSTSKADFPVMVDQLMSQLPEDKVILRLAFFGTPASNDEYLFRRNILEDRVDRMFGDRKPALSYVSQPPLNTPLIVEVHAYTPDENEQVTFGSFNNLPFVKIENDQCRILFAGGFQGDIINQNIGQQSSAVFGMIDGLLQQEGYPVNSIIRQWNYIEHITGYYDSDQHYQSFNNARSKFYNQTTWENGYPAATGIGTNLGGILVDFDAVQFHSPNAYATPIDNKLQIAAHAYSGQVLESASDIKTTPKFERAKSMTFDGRSLIYISGTAAIRGEESLKDVGIEQQLHITMENIAELIGSAKPVILRVYLKDKADFTVAERLLNEYALNIPISYMWADVCRDELLIEIEGIAIQD